MNTKKKTTTRPFVEINDIKYFSPDYLAALHNVSRHTIRNRINDHNITGIVAYGQEWFPDDTRYAKYPNSQTQGKPSRRTAVPNYAGLYHLLKNVDDKLDLLLEHLTMNRTSENHFVEGEHNANTET